MTATGAPAAQPAPVSAGGDLSAAHRELLSDSTLQFEVAEFEPPTPPAWLEPFGEFLKMMAPILNWVFWIGVVAIVLLVIYAVVREIIQRMPSQARKKAKAKDEPAPVFRPTQAQARALLEEADRLAREGRFSEATRVLLHRSIEDMERYFPISISPAMTSREIARLEPLSKRGRDVFMQIARAVETSLFGGRDLDSAQYGACRNAYELFAFEGAKR